MTDGLNFSRFFPLKLMQEIKPMWVLAMFTYTNAQIFYTDRKLWVGTCSDHKADSINTTVISEFTSL